MNDETRIVNLTGHPVTAIGADGQRVSIRADGLLRVYSNVTEDGYVQVNGTRIPTLTITEQQLDAPAAEPGVIYIVSGLVAAKADRDDFVVVSRLERDWNRVVTGCRAFARIRKEV